MSVFYTKTGDTKPLEMALERKVSGVWGSVDLSGATVRLLLRPCGSTAATAVAASVVAPASGGTVSAPVSLGAAGSYEGEWEVTFGDGTVETFPADGYQAIEVLDQIA